MECSDRLEQSGENLQMQQEIEADMQRMEQGATSAVQQEIDAIRWITEGAYKMVRSTYNIREPQGDSPVGAP